MKFIYIYILRYRFESTYQGTLRGYPTIVGYVYNILTLKLFSINLTIILLGNPLTFPQLA